MLAVLFLGMPAYVTWGITTPVLWNTGRKHHEALLQLPVLLLGGAALYGAMQWGVLAAAVVASGMLYLRMLVVGISAFRALSLGLRELLPYVMRGALFSVVCLLAVAAGHWCVGSLDFAALNVALCGLLALAVSVGLVLLRPSLLGMHAINMVVRFVPRLQRHLALPPGKAGAK